MAAGVLRLTSRLPLADALQVESLAYSALLGGREFQRWRSAAPGGAAPCPTEPLAIAREGDRLLPTPDDPANRTAISAAMRDALSAAPANAPDDPSRPAALIHGAWTCFSPARAPAQPRPPHTQQRRVGKDVASYAN